MNKFKNSKKFNISRFFICLLLFFIMTLSPIMLSGCKTDGEDGKRGPQGEQGSQGPAGSIGTQGSQGPAGEDGEGMFVGYDNYIWNGTERTSHYIPNKNDVDAFEQTMGVTEEMSKYFAHKYIDLTEDKIALMSYYKKNANVTIFSDMEITEITVYAEKTGNLDVGTAKVNEIVEARTNGTSLNVSNTTSHQLTQGKNVITFDTPLVVGEDETIVLGGNDSVGLYVAQNIPVDDEAGNFTLIDSETHSDVIETSGNEYADTLAIQVKVNLTKELPIFEGLKEHIAKDIGKLSTIKNVGVESFGPYIYGNENLFAGKTITRISIPVKTLQDQNSNGCYLDLYKIPAYNTPNEQDAITARKNPTLLETPDKGGCKLDPPAIRLTSEQVAEANQKLLTEYNDGGYGWVDFKCNITFGDGNNGTTKETLAFCGEEHGVQWLWFSDAEDKKLSSIDQYYTQLNFIGPVGNDKYGNGEVQTTNYMFFDCYYAVEWSLEQQIEKIENIQKL